MNRMLNAGSCVGKERIIFRNILNFESVKGDFGMIGDFAVADTSLSCSSKENRNDDNKLRKPKKFRAEWMDEVHFKDWLQPFPGDETSCICIACDVVLRCGKSELDKHACGLKHSNKVEEMKANLYRPSQESQMHHHSDAKSIFNREGDQVWIPVTADVRPEESEDYDAGIGAVGFADSQQSEKSPTDIKLTEALIKLFEFADGKVDLSKKRLEMLQEEHALKMQILQKELCLKTLEVEIKQTELKRLKLENSNVKLSQLHQNAPLSFQDQQIHVIHNPLQLQEALQVQLQQLQNNFHDEVQSHEVKQANVSL